MARKKVKLAYIVENSKRNSTFRKRKNGLIKKVNEISTLCGIEACAVIYNQDDPEPEVWPSESGVQHVLDRFQNIPQPMQMKNKLDQERYLNQRIMKAQELLTKQQNENKKKKMENMIDHFWLSGKFVENDDMAINNDFLSFIDEKLRGIDYRLSMMPSEEEVQNNGAHTVNVVGEQTNMGHTHMDNVQGMMIGEDQVMNMGHAQGLVSGGELEAYTGHLSQGLGMETNMGLDTNNMDFMQVGEGSSTNFTNNIDGQLPFADVHVPNPYWPNPHFP